MQDICVFQSKAFGKVLLLDGERLCGTRCCALDIPMTLHMLFDTGAEFQE